MKQPIRCSWPGSDPVYCEYHDTVWGRPVTDSKELFAKLCLDGQQAGLSWITILKKQAGYYRAFHDFEPHNIVKMSEQDIDRLMQEPSIIRNRLKIKSIINNANGFIAIEKSQSFSDFLWQFTDGKTIVNHWHSSDEVPTESEASISMSKALKKAGFTFVGPTICYAFMQAVGMVNDHLVECFCHAPCKQLARR